MPKTRFWGYVLAASAVLLGGAAVALFSAGVAADENRLADGVPVALWLIFGTGLAGLITGLPSYLGYRRNARNRPRLPEPEDRP